MERENDLNKIKSSSKEDQDNSLCLGTCIYVWINKRPQSIVGLIILLISIVLIIIFVAVQLNVIYSQNYGIVIDAGSTGTRVYLYEWKDEKGVLNDYVTEKGNCRLGKLQEVNQNQKENVLLKCVQDVINFIPRSYIVNPPIYLAATAGMRLLELENVSLVSTMFADIKKLLSEKGWNVKYAGIISGETEAISAWITSNFLEKSIGKFKKSNSIKTIGALDLGGASTQIAFESNNPTTTVDLFNDRYSLYAVSYLCYGTNMFYIRYMSSIALDNSESAFNCLLKNTPTTLTEDSMICRVNGSQSIDFTKPTKPIIVDSEKCRIQIKNILKREIQKTNVDKDSKFIAVSSYYYYQNFLKDYYFISNTLSSFIDGTNKFCEEDYTTLETKFPKMGKYAQNYCLVGNYIINLLEIFGFDENSFQNINFTEKIQGITVGWSLGYMIEKTRHIPDAIIYRLNSIIFVIVLVLCSILIIFIITLFLLAMWARRQKISNLNV